MVSWKAYQDLLDRGWRRSGQWVYRPLPDKEAACQCHPYTIRLDANKFQPSKVCPFLAGKCRTILSLILRDAVDRTLNFLMHEQTLQLYPNVKGH